MQGNEHDRNPMNAPVPPSHDETGTPRKTAPAPRANWDDEDELPHRLTASEAAAFRDQRNSPSPWRVVLVQAEAGAVIALLAGLAMGWPALWSALYGAATAVVPSVLMARAVTHLLGRVLGGDQRVREELLALPGLGERLLEHLDLVLELAAVAPDSLEAVGDVAEDLLDAGTVVAERPASHPNVSDFDWRVAHVSSPFGQSSNEVATCLITIRAMMAIIGLRSNMPTRRNGSNRRQSARYGSQTS